MPSVLSRATRITLSARHSKCVCHDIIVCCMPNHGVSDNQARLLETVLTIKAVNSCLKKLSSAIYNKLAHEWKNLTKEKDKTMC